MIAVHKDMFVRLALSAKKLKAQELDNRIKVEELRSSQSPLETVEYPEDEELESEEVFEEVPRPIESTKDDLDLKIDERVQEIIEDPEILALKKQLEKVEVLFNAMREQHEDQESVARVAAKIENIKRLIAERSYV